MGQDTRKKALLSLLGAFYVLGVLYCLLGLSDIALSFPANVRGGYPTCAGCHVQNDGGGAVTKYGRDTIPQRMATWKMKYEQEPLHGAARGNWPEWLSVGGDVRYVNVSAHGSDGFQYHNKFFMQRDVELAVHANEHITVAASAGIYGPDEGTGKEIEIRRHYLKLQLNPYVGMRVGHFVPAYGIEEADHELPTRKRLGLGQGQEVYAAQAFVQTEWGEAFITGVAGKETTVEATKTKGYQTDQDSSPRGAVGKVAAFIGDKTQLGVSVMNLSLGEGIFRHAVGGFVLTGVPWDEKTYFMGEFDRVTEAGVARNVAMTRSGYEVIRGIHLLSTWELDDKAQSPGLALQWFPRPHFEFLGQYKHTINEGTTVDSGTLMFHYYL